MFISDVLLDIEDKGYFLGSWFDIEELKNIDVRTESGLLSFKEILDSNSIDCYPKIVNGSVANVEHSIFDIDIVLYKTIANVNKNSKDIKYGLLVAKFSAAIAKVDGLVDFSEIAVIRQNIYSLSMLSETEKYYIFIRAIYYLQLKTTKDVLLGHLEKLSDNSKRQVLSIAMSIVIADMSIVKSERLLVADMYRLCDMPTNSVSRDLKKLAKSSGVQLQARKADRCQEFNFEPDDTLNEFIEELENF
ncbi:hypothetical protein Q4601_12005 [Shewanella sp. 1_MG-2023]|uniref:tellurite resistance TerB family protein n=1 Tax=unclassified Shewanella TaxID=196818 RepID=UPI0026E3705C|nr:MULTISPECIES: hypothetical protein [unclassified Shewanella]MDO6610524.1 hypothetical protein [Shewanella sp. 7_MG-2023]MDO6770649.1 hypothetical protein [Shewanella sp. 2_MG-2023]MDO6795035.1 hypothetical protein [Shewanella sp. 1_MG-2023]